MRANRITSGFTLIELAIASSLLGVVLTGLMLMFASTNRAQSSTVMEAELDADIRRTLDKIAGLVSLSSRGNVLPAAPGAESPFSTSQIDFQDPTGFAGGVAVWGTTQRIGFQYSPVDPDDGVDNDRNGLVDDGRVVWTTNLGLPGQQSTILAVGVPEFFAGETLNGTDQNGNGLIDERGLAFDFHLNSVTIRLTLSRIGDRGRLFTRWGQRTVSFHNL